MSRQTSQPQHSLVSSAREFVLTIGNIARHSTSDRRAPTLIFKISNLQTTKHLDCFYKRPDANTPWPGTPFAWVLITFGKLPGLLDESMTEMNIQGPGASPTTFLCVAGSKP
jgi:hypothetical protein